MSDSPKNWEDLRPEVKQFALLMERKLREHDPIKGEDSWKSDSYISLLDRVLEETAEMKIAIDDLTLAETQGVNRLISYATVTQNFVNEAIDVANMSMMAIDVLGWFPPLQNSTLEAELEITKSKLESANSLITDLDVQRKEAEAKVKLATASRQDVWFWQGDGYDEPKSLTCPVVMSAETLNTMLDKLAKAEALLGQTAMQNLIAKLEKQQAHKLCEHKGGRAFHQCWCKLDCACRTDRCQPKDDEDLKRIKDYWLFRKGNEDVPGSRWVGGSACRPINPQPIVVGYWAKGERCSDRVQDSDDPADEIKALRRTIAWLVKRQWDADAKAQDISAQDDTNT